MTRAGWAVDEVPSPERALLTLDDPRSHSHKARVIGDIMIVNHEENGPRDVLQAGHSPVDANSFLTSRRSSLPISL